MFAIVCILFAIAIVVPTFLLFRYTFVPIIPFMKHHLTMINVSKKSLDQLTYIHLISQCIISRFISGIYHIANCFNVCRLEPVEGMKIINTSKYTTYPDTKPGII